MPFKTKESKLEWQRRNREKAQQYKATWKAKKVATDPGYFGRQREIERNRLRTKATPTSAACVWCGFGFVKGRGLRFCSVCCRKRMAQWLRRIPLQERVVSVYDASDTGWTYTVVARCLKGLRRAVDRSRESRWEKRVYSISRVLRIRMSRSVRTPTSRRPNIANWDAAIAAVCSNAYQMYRKEVGQGKWKKNGWGPAAAGIAKSIQFRRGCDVTDSVKPKDILKLLKQQGFRCAYTGDELTPDNVSADHFVPLSGGGTHALGNIRLVTRCVNQAKGTMLHGDFVDMCRKVVAVSNLDHNNVNSDTIRPDQNIASETEICPETGEVTLSFECETASELL